MKKKNPNFFVSFFLQAEPKAKVKRAKSIGSDVEASAVDTEDEEDAKPKKKVVAKKEPTKVVNKGKGRVSSLQFVPFTSRLSWLENLFFA